MEDQKKKEKSYHRKKTARILVSFTVFLVLLVLLFLLSVNIGSLKVSFNKLFRGLFIAYDQDVATVYDLRFPRIFISMLAGAAVAVSGVLFQAVLRNPLADPGIMGISSGAGFAAVVITAGGPPFIFLYAAVCFPGRIVCLSSGVQPFLERGIKSSQDYSGRCCSKCHVYRTFFRI